MSFLCHMLKMNGTTACVLANLTLGVLVGLSAAHLLPCIGCAKPMLSKKTKLKLKYFDIPALGEPIRLLLELGGFDWEDERVDFKSWAAMKMSTKYRQIPMLVTAEGAELAQTKAVLRYLAKIVKVDGKKLYPADVDAAFKVDEIVDAFEDVRGNINATFAIKDAAEKEKARKDLFYGDGKAITQLKRIDELVGQETTEWIVSENCSMADIWCFFFLNFLRCGFFDGLDDTVARECKNLDKIRVKVAKIPKVAEYYAKMLKDKPMYKPFASIN